MGCGVSDPFEYEHRCTEYEHEDSDEGRVIQRLWVSHRLFQTGFFKPKPDSSISQNLQSQ
jgi:hypothetical protein